MYIENILINHHFGCRCEQEHQLKPPLKTWKTHLDLVFSYALPMLDLREKIINIVGKILY